MQKGYRTAKEYPFVCGSREFIQMRSEAWMKRPLHRWKELFKEEKVVAVGEIGLDYYWDNEPREVQMVHTAAGTGKRVGSSGSDPQPGGSGRYHGDYEGAWERTTAWSIVILFKRNGTRIYQDGIYIGVGGVVTFKNAKKLKEVVENIPLTSIVLETDCPYMAPEPNRENAIILLISVMWQRRLRIKGHTYEEVVEQTEKNARDMYRL